MGAIVRQNIKDFIGDKIDGVYPGVFIGILDEVPLLFTKMDYSKKNWAKLGLLGEGKNCKEVKLTKDELRSFLNENKDECLIIDPKSDLISKVNDV